VVLKRFEVGIWAWVSRERPARGDEILAGDLFEISLACLLFPGRYKPSTAG